jgi:serine/threonine protein kinase
VSVARSASEQFEGTPRFSVRRRLGAGGSGVVYEAYDRERGAVVALKTLRSADPEDLYRFKQEFRALADISHPNLIALYELLSEGDRWFFTMEMIDGVNFLDHVRGRQEPGLHDSWDDVSTPSVPMDEPASEDASDASPRRPAPSALTAGSLDRLRSALRQLAAGLSALHEAGKLHRDIKPSNVLVSRTGRLVLLDFGLVGELGTRGVSGSGGRHVLGTPSYMSPEQAMGAPLTEASDWCSVGIMLYVALTGTRPFPRRSLDDIVEVPLFEPRPARELMSDLPADLDRLCEGLLRHDPSARPSGREVLALLGVHDERARASAPGWLTPLPEAPFVGRARELAELQRAFEATQQGRAVTLYLSGASGVGKSALVHHFLEDLQRRAKVVLLEGRCYERESVPYKALDSLVDGLSRYLKRLPSAEVEALLPRDLPALTRLFPVLRRVEAVAGARRRSPEIPDLQQMRRRAFRAGRELLARLADRSPVVLFIDDVHWGDADSAALLAEMMRGPDPPALLLIATHHSEEAGMADLLRGVLEGAGPSEATEMRHVRLEALDSVEACALARELVGQASSSAQAEALARESGGSPFLLRELARHTIVLATHAGEAVGERVTLETVLRARLAPLPTEARRLLEAMAVAGQPVSLEVARSTAGLDSSELEALRLLGAAHLVRTHGAREQGQIEVYHDRIREAVLARMRPEEITALHRRLALSLEIAGESGQETLAVHFAAGGEHERAAEHAAAAARQAFDALAFDRAARLYRWTLDLHPLLGPEARRLRVRLAEALANAGRGAQAAQAYLAAAEGAPAAELLDLRRRAAEQLLISGHFDEGIDVLRAVLGSIGMKLAETPARALISLLLRRARIRVRGLRFRERDATQVSAEKLIRIDTCWSVAIGLSFSDTIRGADFQARHLLLALAAGEPYRVARALAMEVGYGAVAGGRSPARTQRLIREATALAERIGHPHALALVTFGAAVAAFAVADWPAARRLSERAEHLLRERCTGVTWELDNVQLITLLSLATLGELREFTGRLSGLLREAEDRGDLYVATSMRTRVAYVAELAADRPEGARQAVREGMRLCSREGFHMQHLWELFAQVEISLYTGDGLDAWERMSEGWPLLVRSHQMRIQNTRIWSYFLRAHCAAAAAACGGPARLLEEAHKDARQIERERTAWGDALARLVRAGLALAGGRREEALSCLARAEAALAAAHMALYAAAARHHRGAVLGGEEGRALMEAADASMKTQGVRNPARLAAKLAPGGPFPLAARTQGAPVAQEIRP